MASASSGLTHLGVTDNQKRWLVAGIALNTILVPQIRPFVEQDVDKEYNNLRSSHKINMQSTSGRLQRWPAGKFLKYENVNGNNVHPRLPGGRYNYSLFDCRVLSHIDFAKLYVEHYMAKFNAFDDHCDASAVLALLGGVPVFSTAVQTASGNVRITRNDWAHCVFSKWDQAKFQQCFNEMEHFVRAMSLPAADEVKVLGELKDWETTGTQLVMNSPVDQALLQLVQQEVKALQDGIDNMAVEFENEKAKIQDELQNFVVILEEMKQRVYRLETGQHNVECEVTNIKDEFNCFKEDTNQKFKQVESYQKITDSRTGLVEDQVQNLQERVNDLSAKSKESLLCTPDSPGSAANPEKLIELIRRKYKGAVLCPFPWCEDELQLNLANIFTRLQIKSKTKDRSRLTDDTVNMTDIFRPHAECDKPRVVLIEGDPGMGKTTYCQKLAYDWSSGEIPPEASFPNVQMLLLLKCRDVHVETASIERAIDDQLLPQDEDLKEKESFFQFIHANQSRILLVVDGLDELHEDLFPSFLPLMQSKVFPNTFIMLTARHEAGMKVRRYCDTLLEMIGYTKDDVYRYICKYFSNHEDPGLAYKLIEKIEDDDQLAELSTNPLNTALLCLLVEETKGELPSKKTELYDDLVSCALLRYFAKKGTGLHDEDPIERFTYQLNQLGKIALQALLKNQLYFSENEMKCDATDFLQLCFLSREPSVSKMRPTACYSFTHKTFQEYFAAFYLANPVFTDKTESEALLTQLSPDDNLQVWEFLVRKVAKRSGEMAVFAVSCLSAAYLRTRSQTIHTTAETDVDILKERPFSWPHELEILSKEEYSANRMVIVTLHLIAECENNENELKDYQKKMVHELARSCPVNKLELILSSPGHSLVYLEYLRANCTMTFLCLREFGYCWERPEHALVLKTVAWIRQSGPFLTNFHLYNTRIRDKVADALAYELQTNRTLTHLKLHMAVIRDPEALALANGIQRNCTLTHLSLWSNAISDVGGEALGKALQTNGVLMYLDLSWNLGGDSEAMALAEALESNCALTFLALGQSGISDNGVPCHLHPCSDIIHPESIGPSGAAALATSLRSNSKLTYLDLGLNKIGNSGAAALGEALQSNSTLTYLYLVKNGISGPGAEALGKALELNHTLTHLGLSKNGISDSGAEALGKALESNHTLMYLKLSKNVISDSGAEALGKALESNHTLMYLKLSKNDISDSGAEALAKAVQSTGTQLSVLRLDENCITSLGAVSLAKALKYNRSLKVLEFGGQRAAEGIGNSGADAFADMLQSNCTLTHLDLRENNVGDSGATALSEAVQYHNNSLVDLCLYYNPVGYEGLANLERVNQCRRVVQHERLDRD